MKQSERERESSRRKRLLALLAAVVRCAVALRPAVHQSASLTCHRCCCPHSALHCPRLASYTASSAMSQRDYDDDDGYGGGQRQQDDKPLSFRSPTSRSTDRYATAADRYSAIATTSGASNGGRDDADRKTGGGDRYGDSRGGGGGGDRYGDRGGDRYSDRGGRGGDRYNSRGGDRGGDRGDDAERGADGSDKRRGGKTGDGFFSNSSGGGRGYERSERGGAGSGGGFRDRDDSADKEGGYQRRERRGRSTHTAVPSLCTAVTRLLSGPLIPLLCLRGSVCQMIGLGTIAGGDRRRGGGGGGGSSREDRERERQERRDRIPAGLPDLDALQLNDPNRPKLKLAPRGTTQTNTDNADGSTRPAAASKPNPFGEAKPREENLASKEPVKPDAKTAE